MMDFALAVPQRPDIVFFSTFNELHENTHIEPTVAFGSLYLDMTRDFIRRGREQWKG